MQHTSVSWVNVLFAINIKVLDITMSSSLGSKGKSPNESSFEEHDEEG
jgi:hypothetical protein